MKSGNLKLFLLIGALVFLLALIWLSLAAITTRQALQAAKNQDWERSAFQAKNSLFLVKPIEAATFKKAASVSTWKEGLNLLLLITEGQTHIGQFKQGLVTSDQAAFDDTAISWWQELFRSYNRFYLASEKSWLVQTGLSAKQLELIEVSRNSITLAEPFITAAVDQDLNFTLLLKNNEELRAGGGFMGSAAAFSVQRGHISQPVFYDIYDLAGQTDKTLPSRPGLREFLSEGGEMSITDANWEADFSSAGAEIISLLNSTPIHKTDVLIAVNLDLIKSILQITGPVKILSLEEAVTPDNLAALARADRLEFFAGDQQKKHFLSELYSQIKVELEELSVEQLAALAHAFNLAVEEKQLMFYSPRTDFQQIFIENKMAGAIHPETDHWIYLVESNVGINKANQAVEREVELEIQAEKIMVKIEFFNYNQPLNPEQVQIIENNPDLLQAAHLGYVNYQRLLTDLSISEIDINCDGLETKLMEKDQVSIIDRTALQIGFLLTVPEQASRNCLIELTLNQPISAQQSWALIKQPGLDQVPYTINFFGEKQRFLLTSDKQLL